MTGASAALTIQGGNVGIGTTMPRATFAVVGNAVNPDDQLAIYGIADNKIGIQTLLDSKQISDYPYGGGNNALSLQPLGGFVGTGTTAPTE